MELINKINLTNFEELFKKLGYKYFNTGKYNLNIIGIRSSNKESNKFDDYLVVEYINYNDNIVKKVYPITTDPGTYYLNNPLNVDGTSILVPGQYRGCWQIGYHQGKYEALVQRKPVKVYRDNNKDNDLDHTDNIVEGMFGINIHKAGANSKQVDKWSAGCQVFAKEKDFEDFMTLCHYQLDLGHGKTFTYTLIDEKDLA